MHDDRKYIVRIFIVLIAATFLVKLFFIQILDENYKAAAENNIIHKVVEYPYRGLIYDRNNQLIVHNEPIFDLMVIPKEVFIPDTLAFCKLFRITREDFDATMNKAKRYSYIQPSQFAKQISSEWFASISDQMTGVKGFYPEARTIRGYSFDNLSNVLGYIGEINQRQLRADTTNYYRQGDYLGITGIESSYENELRGKRGVEYKMVNVRGVDQGSFKDGELDTLSIPGDDLLLSIDLDLQRYAEKLMEGKTGSVVAIEPSTGEILAFVSAPTYKPSLLSGREFSSNYGKLTQDSLKPLFNRPLMAMYPPGSIFKVVQGLIALEEGVVTANEQIYCDNSLIGDHAPPGYYDMRKGIMYSSNNYFLKVFRRIINQHPELSQFEQAPIGLKNWKEQMHKFGLGTPLGVDLPNEKAGQVPGPQLYNRIYGTGRWKVSNLSSLSIGQGETLLNPIQMANLAAIMANRGHYYRPHVVKSVGSTKYLDPYYSEKIETGIKPEHFQVVIEGMQRALSGTAGRAIIKDIEICGKTGTVQNPHGEDHSTFMAFAPMEQPKIAISVYVENAGWGGRAAASISSLMIESYIKGEITRQWLEDFVLKGDFLY
ncbi:peptidoglycan D,D-transpeptidase FtsI family protein [Reichenbachiella agariperforans]|uniref:Penicillin-binding protein 2 n=1 Tax=Reichenbachiella agariperforans TaxID=156994 RepID=A0A1M6TUZ9_REIAG|nr:penicillin-binding transpeptidase domain-containing protein [Reichenbachiella agariperforans]MBU2915585.1 peptidoglycan glycosyltransferase [Reichenbachiella agariperforans]SHK60720.1 penicillin-binding protein 2 [Reichenbachiella agariperforans]